MLNRTRSKTGLAVVALLGALPLMLTTPTANAKTPEPRNPVKPVNIDYSGNPSGLALGAAGAGLDVIGANAPSVGFSNDWVEPGTVATDPLPDPNAPTADPYVSVEPDAPNTAESAKEAKKTDCASYGTARGVRAYAVCPANHWKGGVWYVEDHTGPGWPVHAAVDYWNNSGSGFHVYYGCPANKFHCVKVVEGKYGDDHHPGLTTWTANSSNDFTAVSIRFNDTYRYTPAQLVMCATHELGHAAGLDHEASNVSAMWWYLDGKHTKASNDDFAQLRLHHYNNPSV